MGEGAGLYTYDVVVKKSTFAVSSPDKFLFCWDKARRDGMMLHRVTSGQPTLTCSNC